MKNNDLQEIISVIWEDETTVNPNNWIPCDGSIGIGGGLPPTLIPPPTPPGQATFAGAACTHVCG